MFDQIGFFVEDIIPEQVIIGLAFLVFLLCLYARFKAHSARAAAYLHATLIVVAGYTYLLLDDPSPAVHQFIGRVCIVILLGNIGTWRVFEILAHRKTNGKMRTS